MAVDFHNNKNGSIRFDLLTKLIENGNSYVKESEAIPFITEISVSLNPLIVKIMQGIQEVVPSNNATLTLAWCCYSGIGATMQWHVNWKDLKSKGIFETLTKERGISEMDQFVLDSVGLTIGSEEAKRLSKHIQESARNVIIYMVKHSTDATPEVVKDVYLQACEAMYFYGMAIQMNRLGIIN